MLKTQTTNHTSTADWPGIELKVNDGTLQPLEALPLRPSFPDEPLDDGYLFLKELLPRDDMLRCREEYFKFPSPTGVLKPGSSPVDSIFDQSKDKSMYPGVSQYPASRAMKRLLLLYR
ncbi:hypothetical protein SLS58_011059 [Diplodia intermedia]|uniref:Uncharacterized protein n=1 Tax=Diplodia intermedia TaxID=856260 RepID=A0ABR3T1V3_9PEZI